MSDRPDFVPKSRPRFFRSGWFLAGLGLGVVLMTILSWQAATTDFHPDFTRFHPAISPEASYYPTLDEMRSIVRARCRPGQILVIVGGNSILQGVAQPAEMMWTRKLQERLGDGYCVINFAFRGATPADGGGVLAEVLRDEFPRQIYIANEKPGLTIFPLGNEVYRFVFWQAYFRGLLLKDDHRRELARIELFQPGSRGESLALIGAEWLDAALHFRAFWNRVEFLHLGIMPSLYGPQPPEMFKPRRNFPDREIDGSAVPIERRYQPSVKAIEMEIVRATAKVIYEKDLDGSWRMQPAIRDKMEKSYRAAFPAALHARTLLLVGRDSAFYRRDLTADEKARDEQAVSDTVQLMEHGGYSALDYGKDFAVDDYYDRTHLTPLGGAKLADRVAPKVQAMAQELGYLKSK